MEFDRTVKLPISSPNILNLLAVSNRDILHFKMINKLIENIDFE